MEINILIFSLLRENLKIFLPSSRDTLETSRMNVVDVLARREKGAEKETIVKVVTIIVSLPHFLSLSWHACTLSFTTFSVSNFEWHEIHMSNQKKRENVCEKKISNFDNIKLEKFQHH